MKDNNVLYLIGGLALLFVLFKRQQKPEEISFVWNEDGTCKMFADGSSSCATTRYFGVDPNSICIPPPFPDVEFNGRNCAGKYIDESKTLKLGDFGCDVLLLQQRLNAIEHTQNILKPTGKFCCKTQEKLIAVKGYNSMRLDMFQPDEEIGFNSLQPTSKRNFSYRYMDVDKKNY
tara:strand:+ start:301 stop:825 length:525 start_codon:yes stop_codon:yes gene_type:complete